MGSNIIGLLMCTQKLETVFIALGMFSRPFMSRLASLRGITRKPKNKRLRLGMLSSEYVPKEWEPRGKDGAFQGTHWRVRVGPRKDTICTYLSVYPEGLLFRWKGKQHSDQGDTSVGLKRHYFCRAIRKKWSHFSTVTFNFGSTKGCFVCSKLRIDV